MLTALKTLLLADVWPGGSNPVYGTGSVFISRAAELQAIIDSGIRFPMAQIMPGDFRSDPQHDEEPDLMVGPVVVRLAVGVTGDNLGENPMLGANKTGGLTASAGRGLLELEPRLHAVIGDLNALEGVILQFKRSGDSGAVLYNNMYVAWEDFIFEAICDESTTASSTPAGTMETALSTGDQTATDGTLANVTGLLFALTAGSTYYFNFQCAYQSSLATIGLKLGCTFPSASLFAASARIPISAFGSSSVFSGAIIASGGAVTATATPTTSDTYLANLEGIIIPSVSGNLQVQFAAETTGGTITLKAGSMGQLYLIS